MLNCHQVESILMHKQSVSFAIKVETIPLLSDYQALNLKYHTLLQDNKTWKRHQPTARFGLKTYSLQKPEKQRQLMLQRITFPHKLLQKKWKVFKQIKTNYWHEHDKSSLPLLHMDWLKIKSESIKLLINLHHIQIILIPIPAPSCSCHCFCRHSWQDPGIVMILDCKAENNSG